MEVWGGVIGEVGGAVTLLGLALQDKKHLGISRSQLLLASVILLVVGQLDEVTWQSRLGGAMVGVVLLLFGYFSKEAIGIADGAVILVCGVAFGLYKTVGMTFFAACYAGVCSMVLLLLKKVGKKSRIPFLPFLLLGYLTMRILVTSV